MKHTVELNCFLSSAAMNHDERVRRNHRSIGISITVRYAPLGSSHNRKPTLPGYIYTVCVCGLHAKDTSSQRFLFHHTHNPKKTRQTKMISLPRKVNPIWRIVVGLGLAILMHSAVSFVHFKDFTKSMGKEPYVPFDVVVEALAGFFVTLVGVLSLAGDFRPAKAAAAASAVSLSLNSSSPSFNIFNHRGRSLTQRRK